MPESRKRKPKKQSKASKPAVRSSRQSAAEPQKNSVGRYALWLAIAVGFLVWLNIRIFGGYSTTLMRLAAGVLCFVIGMLMRKLWFATRSARPPAPARATTATASGMSRSALLILMFVTGVPPLLIAVVKIKQHHLVGLYVPLAVMVCIGLIWIILELGSEQQRK